MNITEHELFLQAAVVPPFAVRVLRSGKNSSMLAMSGQRGLIYEGLTNGGQEYYSRIRFYF